MHIAAVRRACNGPGGELRIQWPGEGQPVVMAGPTAFVFEGEWIA
jgi:diaminopimelate epimerase